MAAILAHKLSDYKVLIRLIQVIYVFPAEDQRNQSGIAMHFRVFLICWKIDPFSRKMLGKRNDMQGIANR